MLYSRADIEDAFPERYVDRGYDYQLEGRARVASVSDSGTSVQGTVRGTMQKPYTVEVEIFSSDDDLEFNGVCTCPVGRNCKHVVALLLEALARHKKQPASRRSRTLVHSQAEDIARAPGFRQWLELADDAQDPAPFEAPPVRQQDLLYVLDPLPAGKPGVIVLPVSVRTTVEGKRSKPQPFATRSVVDRRCPKFVTEDDRRILLELLSETPNVPASGRSVHELRPAAAARLMRPIVATGRAYWRRPTGTPLGLGVPRRAEALWRAEGAGQQALVLQPEPPALVLWLEPPWYVDLARDEAGPLETDVPASTAVLIAAAPPLDPDESQEVVAHELDRFARLGLPLPLSVHVIEEPASTPVPVLRLRGLHALLDQQSPLLVEGQLDIAELFFRYGDEEIAATDPRDVLIRKEGERVVRTPRDDAAEEAAREQLDDLGFVSVFDELTLNTWESAYREVRRWDSLTMAGGSEAWTRFSMRDVPRLREEGWEVHVQNDFHHHVVQPEGWYAELVATPASEWFDLDLGIEVDGERVNLVPVLVGFLADKPSGWQPSELQADGPGETVRVELDDGRQVPLPVDRLRPILDALIEVLDLESLRAGLVPVPDFMAESIAELENLGWIDWYGGHELRRLGRILRERGGSILPVDPPRGLEATLRSYQQRGVAWADFLREVGLGGILADEMGLGKTIQALAVLLREKEAGRLVDPALVVAPTSVLGNWYREARRFTPGLDVAVLHGPGRDATHDALDEVDLALTTYNLLPRDGERLESRRFHYLILDEAQRVKNRRSKAARVVRRIQAKHRLCLTGTPVENNLAELYAHLDFLMPGFLGSPTLFGRVFRGPIERRGDEERRKRLVEKIAPLILRRTKDEVAPELPPKSEMLRTVELRGAQRDLYESVRLAMHEKVLAAVRREGLNRSSIVILDALLKLRQACCDPRLVKLDAARGVTESVKLELLMEMLPELVEDGRRILLFSQFASMLRLIENALAGQPFEWVKLTGQTRDREAPIARFQAGEVPLFLISLKAGGVGLNLTAADTVIHYDPWWNPAAEDQATDRAHRIGQDRPVFVYRLVAAGTVEERILEMQERKRALVAGVVDAGAAQGIEFDEDDLEALFAPVSEAQGAGS